MSERRVSTSLRRQQVQDSLGILLLLLVAWEAVVRTGLVSDRVLPTLSSVAAGFPDVLTSDTSNFSHHLWVTGQEVLIGFGIAVVAGLLLGALLATWEAGRRILFPVLVVAEVIPKVALVPLLIVALGYGITSKAAVAALLAFFPMFLNSLQGLSSSDDQAVRLMRSLRATRLQTLRYYLVPNALPMIFSGLKLALTLAFIGAIVGELLTLQSGLGYLINSLKQQLRMDLAYATTIIVAAIGAGLFFAMERLERRLLSWSTAVQPDHAP